MCLRKVRYWIGTGLSRPNWWRTSSICSGVGFLPAKVTAGSLDGITKKTT